MSNSQMFLWWGSGSAPCWKPMIVLAEKGLYDKLPNKLVEFSKNEHKSEDVLKINPRGQMPTFKDGDVVVNESDAICMYLEEKYTTDANRLLPTDISTRAKVYQKMFETQNIRSTIVVPILFYKFRTPKESWDLDKLKTSFESAKVEIQRWEDYLSNAEFLVGDSFTLADCLLFPWLAFFVRMGMPLEERPGLKRYYEKLVKRESIQATWPPHWKDSDGSNMLEEL